MLERLSDKWWSTSKLTATAAQSVTKHKYQKKVTVKGFSLSQLPNNNRWQYLIFYRWLWHDAGAKLVHRCSVLRVRSGLISFWECEFSFGLTGFLLTDRKTERPCMYTIRWKKRRTTFPFFFFLFFFTVSDWEKLSGLRLVLLRMLTHTDTLYIQHAINAGKRACVLFYLF